jgi:DNA modification methylase
MEINRVYNENCLDTMGGMPNNFCDMVLTSPPYDDLRAYKGYSFEFEKIAAELFRVLKVGGVVVWVVSDKTVNGSESGTSFKQALYFKEIGFKLYDTMIFQKSYIPKTHRRYEQAFEYMFVLLKGEKPNAFNPIMQDNLKFGKKKSRGKNEATARLEKTSASAGVLKSAGTLTKEKSIAPNVFYYPVGYNLTSKDKITFQHPAPFPEKLAEDQIYSWSDIGNLVYDPFGGSGTTAKMSQLLGRNFVLSEISSDYAQLAEKRLADTFRQNDLFTTI